MKINLTLHKLYQSGMVLLRNTDNCISGYAEPGLEITFNFRGLTKKALVENDGSWEILFNPGEASGPDTLKVESSAGEVITLENIYTGEVWLCSGQSNMQVPMDRIKFSYPEEMKLPANQNIRLFTVPISSCFGEEKKDLPDGKWLEASPETLYEFSGTAYFFAKSLQKELGIPVGIINASQGGSPIASWVDTETLKGKKNYLERIENCLDPKFIEKHKKNGAKAIEHWNKNLTSHDIGLKNKWATSDYKSASDWKEFPIPGFMWDGSESGCVWFKKELVLTAEEAAIIENQKTWLWLGVIQDADTAYINGKEVGSVPYMYPPRRYVVPAGTLHEGSNCITLRVQQSGRNLQFSYDKPYMLFTDNLLTKNWREALSSEIPSDLVGKAVKIDLSGKWKYCRGCNIKSRPGDIFFEWEPTALYNAMLAPLFKTAIRGALWYQGESDCGRVAEYEGLLTDMVNLWRRKFTYAKSDFPFIVVQLPNNGWPTSSQLNSGWAEMREVQTKVVKNNKNMGLAVTIDVGEGNDLHPENKLDVGKRSAFEALRLAYGKNDVPDVPVVIKTECIASSGKIGVSYQFTFDKDIVLRNYEERPNLFGAWIKKNDGLDYVKPVMGTQISGFSGITVKENGELFIQPLSAKLTEVNGKCNTVTVYLPGEIAGQPAPKFTEIRFIWGDCPDRVTIFSTDGLPAAPFRMKL